MPAPARGAPVRQWPAAALLLATAAGLSLTAEFGGRSNLAQPPAATLAVLIATLLWLRGAAVHRRPAALVVTALTFGVAVWTLSPALSVALHLARGEEFDFFEQFDSKAARAGALVTAHAVFLGAPTGVFAALGAAAAALIGARRSPRRDGCAPRTPG